MTMHCLLGCQAWKEPEKFSSVQTLHGKDQKTGPVGFHFIFPSLATVKSLYRILVENGGKEWLYIGSLHLGSYCHLVFTPLYKEDVPILQIKKLRLKNVKAIFPRVTELGRTKPYQLLVPGLYDIKTKTFSTTSPWLSKPGERGGLWRNRCKSSEVPALKSFEQAVMAWR